MSLRRRSSSSRSDCLCSRRAIHRPMTAIIEATFPEMQALGMGSPVRSRQSGSTSADPREAGRRFGAAEPKCRCAVGRPLLGSGPDREHRTRGNRLPDRRSARANPERTDGRPRADGRRAGLVCPGFGADRERASPQLTEVDLLAVLRQGRTAFSVWRRRWWRRCSNRSGTVAALQTPPRRRPSPTIGDAGGADVLRPSRRRLASDIADALVARGLLTARTTRAAN